MSRKVTSAQVVNVADLRLLAKKRLPRVAFDYIDGGADGEVTLRENCRVFDDVALRPRSAVVTKAAQLRTSVLGTDDRVPGAARAGRKLPDVLADAARRRRRAPPARPARSTSCRRCRARGSRR